MVVLGEYVLNGIIAGGCTGAVNILITYPAEYVKTHLQLDGKGSKQQYNGIIDCVTKTVKKHGYFGLYTGMSILFYGAVPIAAVRFGSFEFYKGHMLLPSGNLSANGRLLSGLGAGVTEAIFVGIPVETIKVKFIFDRRLPQPQFKSLLHGISLIVQQSGIVGLYQGTVPMILRQGTNHAGAFYLMETCKEIYREGDPKKHVPTYIIGIFGLPAGMVPILINNPIDVVKTRMQGLDANLYRGTWDCFVKTWSLEGTKAFYKGLMPRLFRACFEVALTFMMYDNFMYYFNKF